MKQGTATPRPLTERLRAAWHRMDERWIRLEYQNLDWFNPNCSARAQSYRAAKIPGVSRYQ